MESSKTLCCVLAADGLAWRGAAHPLSPATAAPPAAPSAAGSELPRGHMHMASGGSYAREAVLGPRCFVFVAGNPPHLQTRLGSG